jgi:hypothetical protein
VQGAVSHVQSQGFRFHTDFGAVLVSVVVVDLVLFGSGGFFVKLLFCWAGDEVVRVTAGVAGGPRDGGGDPGFAAFVVRVSSGTKAEEGADDRRHLGEMLEGKGLGRKIEARRNRIYAICEWAYGVGCPKRYKTAAGCPLCGRATPETAERLFQG